MDRRFPVWCLLIVGGFCYVSGVLCHRFDPLLSGHERHGDIAAFLLIAPLLYWLGPRHNLPALAESSGGKSVAQWVALYALPFFLALHWKYLGEALAVDFQLTPSSLSGLDRRAAGALAVGVCAAAAVVAYHLGLARRGGILAPYVGALLGIPLAVAAASWVVADRYFVHVHHYMWGGFLFPFFRFRPPSVAAQAVFLGVCVEGMSRWGMEALWYAR